MKLALEETKSFISLHMDNPDPWKFRLHAGVYLSDEYDIYELEILLEDQLYDVELLPSIFTYREILWQPNVYANPKLCIPGLKLLQAYCEEFIEGREVDSMPTEALYVGLMRRMAKISAEAAEEILLSDKEDLPKILGHFRNQAFPIVRFFYWHPMNRREHVAAAKMRMNYTVKILLTQYHNDFSELVDPYWRVTKTEVKKNGQDITPTESPIEIEPSDIT